MKNILLIILIAIISLTILGLSIFNQQVVMGVEDNMLADELLKMIER